MKSRTGYYLLALWCLAIASCDKAHDRHQERTSNASTTTPANAQKSDVITLLRQMPKDTDGWEKRNRSMSDRSLTQFMGTEHWYRRFPVSYAEERLITKGSGIGPILIGITRDREYSDIHYYAWKVLAILSPPTQVNELCQAGREGRLQSAEVSALLVWPWSGPPTEDNVIGWLGKQLTEKGFDETVLSALDSHINQDYAHGGLHPRIIDERVLRWLNRVYDVDFDSWLAAKAPVAYKFRKEQLAKGYDPVSIVSGYVYRAMSDHQLKEALDAIYTNPQDRKAFEELIRIIHDDLSTLHPQPTSGWEQRLRRWYRSQRALLKYDPSLGRFVPMKGPAELLQSR